MKLATSNLKFVARPTSTNNSAPLLGRKLLEVGIFIRSLVLAGFKKQLFEQQTIISMRQSFFFFFSSSAWTAVGFMFCLRLLLLLAFSRCVAALGMPQQLKNSGAQAHTATPVLFFNSIVSFFLILCATDAAADPQWDRRCISIEESVIYQQALRQPENVTSLRL